VIVVHQRNPIGGEAPTKYHGRACKKVTNRIFLDSVATGTHNAEWFGALDARRRRPAAPSPASFATVSDCGSLAWPGRASQPRTTLALLAQSSSLGRRA
jgi:hypothetical protein